MSPSYPEPVGDQEALTRFLLEKKKFAASTGRVKYRAFLPPPASQAISVYRVDDLDQEDLWSLGQEYVAIPTGKPLLARGDVPAALVFAQGLQIDSTETPHPRHANIHNFPADATKVRLIAIVLADASKLHVAP